MSYLRRCFSGENGVLRFVLLFLTLALSVSGFSVQAEGSGVEACAVTPNLIGGQGFSVSGQGFSVSGQGFSVSGQGFSVSGQGFSVSGQGLDPLVVAAEIRDNPVTPGKWIDDRLQFFLDRLGFNTDATAILVIDEFNAEDAHGVLVQKVVEDSLATLRESVPDLKVGVFPVDISAPDTNYSADVIAGKITDTINGLRETYNHFVLNMSFGLIACEDEGPVVDGETLPPFNFNEAIETVEANNEAEPTLEVEPVLECVRSKGFGLYVAYFGYKNANGELIKIPVGYNNKFSPLLTDVGQPTEFEPGQQHFVFAIIFKGHIPVTWTLKGPDGQSRSVTASSSSTPCETVPAHPSQAITPILECVTDLGENVFAARFGYNNPNALGVKIPVGWYNKFSPHPENRGQVTTFVPGLHESVFEVEFNGSGSLTWKLSGSTVTATKDSPVCPEPEGFGVGNYLTQNLGVPEDKVEEYWAALADEVAEDELQTLRNLLADYLADSSNPDLDFSAVAIASSGNFRPWLGAAPLAPASWPETIAVGATLNDNSNLWSFSQDANVVAPGAGYPLDTPNSFAAGTSFAAPAFSVLVGICSTVPGALDFDGVLPPLSPALDASGGKLLNNSFINVDNFAPLACKPNGAPVLDAVADRTDPEGASVLFDVTASDPDTNPLTFTAEGLPPGVSIDSQGRISGLLSNTSAGEYDVTVTVTDSNSDVPGTDEITFHWTVTEGDTALNVGIDIKPLSSFNRINLKSHGKLSVAILSSATFDARTVNPRTVTLAGSPVIIKWGQPLYLIVDVNFDGRKDLVVWVKVRDLQLDESSTSATLEGETYTGQAIQGTDFVTIVPPHAPYLTSPLTGSSHRNRSLILTWEAVDEEEEANTCFVVQIDNNSNFSSPEQSAISVGLPRLSTYTLPYGSYFWRVAVSDCATQITSNWSQVWTFTIRR